MTTQPLVLQQPEVGVEPVTPVPTDRKYGSRASAPVLNLSISQAASDPHQFRQWKRRVSGWQVRCTQWLPPGEMGLVLLEAIQGDAALLCQEAPLQRLYARDGVQQLLDQLQHLEQQRAQGLGAAVRAYEELKRLPMEHAKSYNVKFSQLKRNFSDWA